MAGELVSKQKLNPFKIVYCYRTKNQGPLNMSFFSVVFQLLTT